MKTPVLLLALAMATTAVAFVPSAEAAATCTFLDYDCPSLVCYGYNSQTGWQRCYPRDWVPDPIIVCVTEPCPQPLP